MTAAAFVPPGGFEASVPARAPDSPEAPDDSSWRLLPWGEDTTEVPVIDPPPVGEWRGVQRAGQPVLLRGLAARWEATQRWTFEGIARRIGPRLVPAVRVHDGLLGYRKHQGMDYEERPFDEVAGQIARGEPQWFLQLSPDGHLPELACDLEVPIYSRDAPWRARRLTIAAPGTTTPIHRELPDNIFSVFCGEKEVVLFPPSDSRNLYGYGPLSGIPHLSRVDPRGCDLDRYPRLRRSRPFRCRLRAGDALLIPRRWWHAVHTIEPSIALGSWWATGLWSLMPRAAAVYKRVFGIQT